MMFGYVRVVSGPDAGRTFNLSDNQTIIVGRSEKSDTRLTDPRASRMHCEIRVENGAVRVVDLNSVAGTLVNGAKVAEARLKSGDTIQVADTQLRLQLGGEAESRDVAAAQKAARELGSAAVGMSGRMISHYEVGAQIAKGKTATVYKGRDTRDGKPVALKVMHPGFADDEEDVQRFIRSVKTVINLRHPNLVAMHGAGKAGDLCWVALEYVEGESVKKVIDRMGTVVLDWRHAVTIATHVARGLQAAHDQHIVHRNVMPENILVSRGPKLVAKLGDLMLAKALDGLKANPITRPGQLVGEIAFSSPERVRGDLDIDTRSDIYSLGATLYTLLAGRPPFSGNLVELLTQVRLQDPIPPQRFQPAIPGELQDAVMKMLAKRPEMRFQSPAELGRELTRIARSRDLDV